MPRVLDSHDSLCGSGYPANDAPTIRRYQRPSSTAPSASVGGGGGGGGGGIPTEAVCTPTTPPPSRTNDCKAASYDAIRNVPDTCARTVTR